MSTNPFPRPAPRHALGLPAGSVRALLSLGILFYLWVMALVPGVLDQKYAATAFVYMQLMMILVICHFTAAHGRTIGKNVSLRSPLYLPRGVARLLLIAGYFGLAYWTWKLWAEGNAPSIPDIEVVLIVLAVVTASFLIGHLSTNLMYWVSRTDQLPFWFQDIQAWFGLVSLGLLGFVLIARLVINLNVSPQTQLTLKYSEPAMAAFVAYYFGART